MLYTEKSHRIFELLKTLWVELRFTDGPCPFVVDDAASRNVDLTHQSAGREATYVHIARRWNGELPLNDVTVSIRPSPFVEGTTIIYDMLDETLQGKARPFGCISSPRYVRPYLLLPFQIEQISIVARSTKVGRFVKVAFLDAQDQIIQAALPFVLRFTDWQGNTLKPNYSTTNRYGRFTHQLAPSTARVEVHSCLTGRDQALNF